MTRAGRLLLVVTMVVVGGCGGNASEAAIDPEPDAAVTAPTTQPTATADPTVTPAPTATQIPTPEPTATATPTPEPTATPEPLAVMSLADAKGGVAGANWVAVLGGPEVPFTGLDAPNGEALSDPEGLLDFVEHAVVLSGTPADEWVEIDIGWAGNGSTAWIRTADYTFTQTPGVFEIVRSTGELRLWEEGEAVWSATDLAPRERAEQYAPIAVGSVTGLLDAERFSGRFGPEFHPQIISTSILLEGADEFAIAPLGIRGFTAGEYIEGSRRGVQVWVSSQQLEELLVLMPPGTRVEIVP